MEITVRLFCHYNLRIENNSKRHEIQDIVLSEIFIPNDFFRPMFHNHYSMSCRGLQTSCRFQNVSFVTVFS